MKSANELVPVLLDLLGKGNRVLLMIKTSRTGGSRNYIYLRTTDDLYNITDPWNTYHYWAERSLISYCINPREYIRNEQIWLGDVNDFWDNEELLLSFNGLTFIETDLSILYEYRNKLIWVIEECKYKDDVYLVPTLDGKLELGVY
jgi:hypothetical protein